MKIKELIKEYNTLAASNGVIDRHSSLFSYSYGIHPEMVDFNVTPFGSKSNKDYSKDEKLEQLKKQIIKLATRDIFFRYHKLYKLNELVKSLELLLKDFYINYYKDDEKKYLEVEMLIEKTCAKQLTMYFSSTNSRAFELYNKYSFSNFKSALEVWYIKETYEKMLKLEQEYYLEQQNQINEISLLGLDEIARLIEEHQIKKLTIQNQNGEDEEIIIFDDMCLGKKLLAAKLICQNKKRKSTI